MNDMSTSVDSVTGSTASFHGADGGSIPTSTHKLAHQKRVRDIREVEDKNNLFGDWWSNIDKDLSKAVVREISLSDAKVIIEQYEWLGCMPAVNLYAYGIFFQNTLGGVVVFGTEYSENLGVWDKYDYTGKLILLSRGVCVHWTPPNTASKLISIAIKMLPEKYKVVTCTTDILAGEVGTIYQACNFVCVGSMREKNPKIKNKVAREAWEIKGKLYGSRAIRAMIGSQRKSEILKYFPDAKYVEQVSKTRYFYFRGTKKEQIYHRSKIEHLISPYPKR